MLPGLQSEAGVSPRLGRFSRAPSPSGLPRASPSSKGRPHGPGAPQSWRPGTVDHLVTALPRLVEFSLVPLHCSLPHGTVGATLPRCPSLCQTLQSPGLTPLLWSGPWSGGDEEPTLVCVSVPVCTCRGGHVTGVAPRGRGLPVHSYLPVALSAHRHPLEFSRVVGVVHPAEHHHAARLCVAGGRERAHGEGEQPWLFSGSAARRRGVALICDWLSTRHPAPWSWHYRGLRVTDGEAEAQRG